MSNLTIQVGAEVTGLQTGLALASAESKKFAADVRDLAKQIIATSDDAIKGRLVGELRNAAAEASKSAAEVKKLKSEIADLGNSKGGSIGPSQGELQAQIEAITGVSGAYRNAEESAAVFGQALGVPTGAAADFAELNKAIEGTRVSSSTARESIVILHETIQGRFSRIPGSLLVLSEQFGGIGLSTVGAIAGVGALGFALYELAENAIQTESSIRNLEGTIQSLGQTPAGGFSQVRAEVANLAKDYGLSTAAAAKFDNSIRSSSTVTSEQVIKDIQSIATAIAQQKGEFGEIDKIGEGLAKKSQSEGGLKSLSEEMKLNLGGAIEAVRSQGGTLADQQKLVFDAIEKQYGEFGEKTKEFRKQFSFKGILEKTEDFGIGAGLIQALRAPFNNPGPDSIKLPALGEGQEDQTAVLKRNIQSAREQIALLNQDQTKSAEQRKEAEAEILVAVPVPAAAAGSDEARKLSADVQASKNAEHHADDQEFIRAEESKNAAIAATGRQTRAETLSAELATDQAILERTGLTADERVRYEQQSAIKTAEVSKESAEERIKSLERVAEVDKSGSAKRIADLKTAQATAETLLGANSPEALQLSEKVAQNERENAEQRARAAEEASKKAIEAAKKEAEEKKRALEEYFKEYTAGIQQQIALAKGNFQEQSALVQSYVDVSRNLFTQNSNEFREAERLKTSIAKAETAERVKLADDSLKTQIAALKGQERESLAGLDSKPDKGVLADPGRLAGEKEAIIAASALAEDAIEKQRDAAAVNDKAVQAAIFKERVDLATAAESQIIKLQRDAAAQAEAQFDTVNKKIGEGLADAINDAILRKKGGAGAAFGKFLDEQLKSAIGSGLSNTAGFLEKSIGLSGDGKSPGGLVNSGLDSLGLGGVGSFLGIGGGDKGKDPVVQANIDALRANTAALVAQATKAAAPGGGQANFSAGFEGGFGGGQATTANTDALRRTEGSIQTLSQVTGQNSTASQVLGEVTKIQTIATLPNTLATIANTIALDVQSVGKFLGFADGGRPPTGRMSIVGERGPEIFMPDSAGTIYPNGQLPPTATAGFGSSGGGNTTNIGGSSRGGDSRSMTFRQTNTVNLSNPGADLRTQMGDLVKRLGKSGAQAALVEMMK